MEGSVQQALFKAQRDAINDGISITDIAGVEAGNMVLGEANAFTNTWYGPTGFYSWNFDDGSNRGNWAWTTSLQKVANQTDNGATPVPATDYALLAQTQYQDIHGCSKRIWIPGDCVIRIMVQAELISPTMSKFGPTYRLPGYSGNTGSKAYIYINGAIRDLTLGYSFEDSIGAPPAGEVGAELTDSTNEPSKLWARRYYSCFYDIIWEGTGWLETKLVVDCRNERTFASRRSIHIQGIYHQIP